MSVSIEYLSASVSGQPIRVTGNSAATPTLIHTSVGSVQLDEIFMYATNTGLGSLTLYVDFGGSNTNNRIITNIPPQDGLSLIIPGLPLGGGQSINVFAQSGNFINIAGYVQRGP